MDEQRVKWNGINLKRERVKRASHRRHLQVRKGHFPRGTLPFSERWMPRDKVRGMRWGSSWGGQREKCAQAQVWSEGQVIIIHFWWTRDKWRLNIRSITKEVIRAGPQKLSQDNDPFFLVLYFHTLIGPLAEFYLDETVQFPPQSSALMNFNSK